MAGLSFREKGCEQLSMQLLDFLIETIDVGVDSILLLILGVIGDASRNGAYITSN